MKYDNVLNGANIDIDAFAETLGNTITLNKFMYDDSIFMVDAYKESVKKGMFVKGSTYLNVIDHEVMHLKPKRQEAKKSVKKFIENNKDKWYNLNKFIKSEVSIYASKLNDKNLYIELGSELNVLKIVNIDKFNELMEKRDES